MIASRIGDRDCDNLVGDLGWVFGFYIGDCVSDYLGSTSSLTLSAASTITVRAVSVSWLVTGFNLRNFLPLVLDLFTVFACYSLSSTISEILAGLSSSSISEFKFWKFLLIGNSFEVIWLLPFLTWVCWLDRCCDARALIGEALLYYDNLLPNGVGVYLPFYKTGMVDLFKN